jgi:hypothetical protein
MKGTLGDMKAKFASALAVSIVVLSLFCAVPFSFAQETTLSYQLQSPLDGTYSYNLNVIIPETINNYYKTLSHRSASDADFPKFVTPYALKPVADCMREIYQNDEQFANGVLTLVHQITYEEIVPAYYPTETMTRGTGDCDLFSIVAASILKAGALDVVLLHYVDQEHMNIGVHLAESPKAARMKIYSADSDGVKYYVAECTSSDWQNGWRVGECPEDLRETSPLVISLDNSEQVAPGQVSASFTTLDPTTLTLEVTPTVTLQGNTVTIRGQLTPTVADEEVTLYASSTTSPIKVLGTTLTMQNGSFTYTWQSNVDWKVDVYASWTGNGEYAGTTSSTTTLFIIPLYLIAAIAAVVAIIILGGVVAVIYRRKRNENQPPPPPSMYIPQPPQPTAVN